MGPILTQAEGFILGVGAKMFTIAGRVIFLQYGYKRGVRVIYWVINFVNGT